MRKKYFKQGIKAIEDKQKKNPKELLTKPQKQKVLKILRKEKPKDYDYNSDYWTIPILGNLIKARYNIQHKSKTSFYLIFKQAKFSYRKPWRVYHSRDEKEVQRWQKTNKPELEKAFKERNTIIFAEDEMIFSTRTTLQKIWLLQGENPKIEVSNKKQNRSIYGFLNIKTGKEHSFKTQKQNMFITADILKELRKIYPKKIANFLGRSWLASWLRGSKIYQRRQKY